MKIKILSFLFLFVISFSSCEKDKFFKSKDDKKDFDCTLCENNDYEDLNNPGSDLQQYILKPIVVDESCGCIVSGYVKYLKNGKTVALVDYSIKDSCDGWAVKTICYDGDCKHKKATCCKFEQVCDH